MLKNLLRFSALSIASSSFYSYATETTFSGFASIVGGAALSTVELPGGGQSNYLADYGYSFGGLNERSFYTDTVSYSPDTNYGLQIKSDLNDGLSLVAQLAGRGAIEFDTEIEWLYLSLDLSPNLTLQFGRQRTPLYFYSDFLDIGYAYHWIRPPVEVYTNNEPNYEGVSLNYSGTVGNWAAKLRVYTGAVENPASFLGPVGSEVVYGVNFSIGNDYLQLNLSSLAGDFYTDAPATNKDNPSALVYGSAAVNLTLGGFFLFAEAILNTFPDDDGYLAVFDPIVDTQDRFGGLVSIGYEIGAFTPHLTVAQFDAELYGGNNPQLTDEQFGRNTVTAGLRWDFHSSSAFKIEFSSTVDDSTTQVLLSRGRADEADLLSMGFDLVF